MRFTFLFRCLRWHDDACFEHIMRVTAPSVEFGELILMRLGFDVVESRPDLKEV